MCFFFLPLSEKCLYYVRQCKREKYESDFHFAAFEKGAKKYWNSSGFRFHETFSLTPPPPCLSPLRHHRPRIKMSPSPGWPLWPKFYSLSTHLRPKPTALRGGRKDSSCRKWHHFCLMQLLAAVAKFFVRSSRSAVWENWREFVRNLHTSINRIVCDGKCDLHVCNFSRFLHTPQQGKCSGLRTKFCSDLRTHLRFGDSKIKTALRTLWREITFFAFTWQASPSAFDLNLQPFLPFHFWYNPFLVLHETLTPNSRFPTSRCNAKLSIPTFEWKGEQRSARLALLVNCVLRDLHC